MFGGGGRGNFAKSNNKICRSCNVEWANPSIGPSMERFDPWSFVLSSSFVALRFNGIIELMRNTGHDDDRKIVGGQDSGANGTKETLCPQLYSTDGILIGIRTALKYERRILR